MPTYISLLRGINVGGHKTIRMADLKTLYESLGLSRVAAYVQSGNVIFDADAADPAALATRIEAAIARHFSFDVAVLLRAPDDLRHILDNNPFLAPDVEPAKLHVLFLAAPPAPETVDRLNVPATSGERWMLAGREIYIHYPNGSGRSKVTGAFFERRLGVVASARNWNSVNALYDLTRRVSR